MSTHHSRWRCAATVTSMASMSVWTAPFAWPHAKTPRTATYGLSTSRAQRAAAEILMQRSIFESEHDQFRESARRFFQTEIGPNGEAWREQGSVDRDAFRKAGE